MLSFKPPLQTHVFVMGFRSFLLLLAVLSTLIANYLVGTAFDHTRCRADHAQQHIRLMLQGMGSEQPTRRSEKLWNAHLNEVSDSHAWTPSGSGQAQLGPAHASLHHYQGVIENVKVQQAALRPVVIGVVGHTGSGHLSGMQASGQLNPEHPWYEPNCSYDGVPVECIFSVKQPDFAWADGLYFHIPSHSGRIMAKQHPQQLRFAVSMESAAFYPWQDDDKYMCQFEAEATFRSCSQVPNNFHHERHQYPNGTTMLHDPEFPFEQKEHAVAYLNSNCGTRSGRAAIMKEWMKLADNGGRLQIHSYGQCDNNRQFPDKTTKIALFRKYKYCIAMENSIAFEYVTEKIWDALAAGCVPIYLGTLAYKDIVPDPYGVITYGPGGDATSVQELDALLHHLGSDKAAYERLLQWKHQPIQRLSPGYQAYQKLVEQNNECRMCAHIIQHRMSPCNTTYTTCLWNTTWMQRAGKTVQGVPAC